MRENEHVSKQNIRNRYLSLRNSLSTQERIQKSRKIWERLKSVPAYRKAQAVLVYMDYRSEVMTTGLVEELFEDPLKKVFAPKVEGMRISFYEISSLEELEDGYQGIREPKKKPERKFTKEMPKLMDTVILIPGAVFDRQRGRMGYGKGFYDRFLSEYPGIYGIALGFACQIAKTIPMEQHDKRPDLVVTENEMIG